MATKASIAFPCFTEPLFLCNVTWHVLSSNLIQCLKAGGEQKTETNSLYKDIAHHWIVLQSLSFNSETVYLPINQHKERGKEIWRGWGLVQWLLLSQRLSLIYIQSNHGEHLTGSHRNGWWTEKLPSSKVLVFQGTISKAEGTCDSKVPKGKETGKKNYGCWYRRGIRDIATHSSTTTQKNINVWHVSKRS